MATIHDVLEQLRERIVREGVVAQAHGVQAVVFGWVDEISKVVLLCAEQDQVEAVAHIQDAAEAVEADEEV